MNRNILKFKKWKRKKNKWDHKLDAKRILSCSVSVLLRTESLLDPGDSLCWVEDDDAAATAAAAAAAAAERTGGKAPDDICRNKLTRWGTVVRMPLCRFIPWIAAAVGGTMEARESPEAGCTLGPRDVSCGSDGWEADKCLTSRLKLPDCRACVLLWMSPRWGEGTCCCCCWGDDCCCCCAADAAAAGDAAGCWASCCCCVGIDGWGMGCWMRDSWEAVRELYWKLRLARGVCTGGLHIAAVKEQGDMIAPCCWSGVCGFIADELRLPWDRLGAG